MQQLNKFIEGLTILSKYYDDPGGYHIGVEQDTVRAYATQKPVTPEDLAKLGELGWFQPDIEEEASYDPKEGWAAFT